MTTNPTPHTERAAAAAAEIANLWLRICKEPPCGCDECQEDMAAIIDKQFNDDALRLAAGRALELLERMKNGVPACDENGALYVEHFGLDGNSAGIEYVDPIAVIDCMIGTANAAITALSAALAGDKGKE